VDRKTTRIVFAGGGTGGHLYPALAVAAEFGRRDPGASIVFVGAKRGLEQRLVPAAGYPLRTLPLSGLKGASAPAKLVAATAAGWATLRCVVWMLGERPDLVIGVGGYVSGPAVLAGRLLGVPTMVMEQNHFPGTTNRWLAPRVDAVCLPSEAARARIGGKTFVTGNPVRAEFAEIGEPQAHATAQLFVFGGSRGAHSINRAMCEALSGLARISPAPSITHQTGPADETEVGSAYDSYPGKHEVRSYFDDMPARVAAADIVVCRAGASTIAELCAAGRPAVLVPYPYAADDHQRHNAETLRDAGAALMVADADLDGDTLAAAVAGLAGDAERRREMGRAARSLALPDAAARIVDIAEGLLGRQTSEDRDVP
jgi:UDP-N-acetylglucosamine--N-acetylmuramyl-(pentapeptide) pyrophosphoryl-undecaprenol N-acetylglucosamine transferase